MLKIERLPEFDDHELILRLQDTSTGLKGFIAIHTTNPGPAVGGTRFWYYKNEQEALQDALRLSRAMTYKCALANVPYGGGKAVLMAPKGLSEKKKLKIEKYLVAYTKRLNILDGHFFTGEDVGISEQDIEILARNSTSIVGRPSIGGLPSYWAALSVFESMRAALKIACDSDSFEGRSVAIKGVGNVGYDLCELLSTAGATILAADVNPDRIQKLQTRFPDIRIVSPALIHKQTVDIYSPCALNADLTLRTIKELDCKIVCGSANNQLATDKDSARLFKRGIMYIPDYVANAGGLINVVDELHSGGYDKERVTRNVSQVRETVLHILSESKRKNKAPDVIADQLAEQRFKPSK